MCATSEAIMCATTIEEFWNPPLADIKKARRTTRGMVNTKKMIGLMSLWHDLCLRKLPVNSCSFWQYYSGTRKSRAKMKHRKKKLREEKKYAKPPLPLLRSRHELEHRKLVRGQDGAVDERLPRSHRLDHGAGAEVLQHVPALRRPHKEVRVRRQRVRVRGRPLRVRDEEEHRRAVLVEEARRADGVRRRRVRHHVEVARRAAVPQVVEGQEACVGERAQVRDLGVVLRVHHRREEADLRVLVVAAHKAEPPELSAEQELLRHLAREDVGVGGEVGDVVHHAHADVVAAVHGVEDVAVTVLVRKARRRV
eukprot:Rhum_TRINITY_DN14707_c0_g1::Rhum_TRINITY_DN14707_c0_g1_i1::g.110617::m.110617